MNETQPKGHHFVQKAYLDGFADPTISVAESRIWVYISGKSPFPQKTERVARRNYYYCHQDNETRKFDAEHQLQQLEDLAMPPLRRLREGRFELSPEDKLTFSGYIALSHTRVPTFERSMNRITELLSAKQLEFTIANDRALQSIVNKLNERSGEKMTLEEYRKQLTGGNVVVSQTNRGWTLRQMFQMLFFLQRVIFDMAWTFLLASEGDDGFLTSDNPVALFDPNKGFGGVGFASSPAAHFTFPVSRDICILATQASRPLIAEINASKVRSVNSGTISRADSQVYAPFKSRSVQNILDATVKERPRRKRILMKMGRVSEE